MKTPEEILKLSYAYSDKVNMSKDMTSLSIADAVTYGYNQCKQDMADNKYTEKDMLKCWDACKRFERPISEGYAPNFNDFINSLNKD